jgi:hypothetical protein
MDALQPPMGVQMLLAYWRFVIWASVKSLLFGFRQANRKTSHRKVSAVVTNAGAGRRQTRKSMGCREDEVAGSCQ